MRRALLSVPVLSCLLLAACSGSDASPDVLPTRAGAGAPAEVTPPAGGEAGPAARLARAPAATAASGTARVATFATVTGLPGRRQPFTLQSEGAVDFTAGRSWSILRPDGQTTGGTDASATELETVVAGGVVYVRAPALTSLSGASAGWVRIEPAIAGAGPALGPLTELASSNLGAPLAMLAGVTPSSVREVGTEVGTEAGPGGAITLIQATVDLVAASAEGATTEDLSALGAFLDRLGARQLQVEVELDGHDRIRRLIYEHDVPSPAGPVHQRFDVAYSDFGADVEIATPPDDQVRDLGE